MAYRVKLTKQAYDNIRSLERREQVKLQGRLKELGGNPNQLGKYLLGPLKGYKSIHFAGRYRIVYKVKKQEVIVLVVGIGIRREGDNQDIYEHLKKLLRSNLLE